MRPDRRSLHFALALVVALVALAGPSVASAQAIEDERPPGTGPASFLLHAEAVLGVPGEITSRANSSRYFALLKGYSSGTRHSFAFTGLFSM